MSCPFIIIPVHNRRELTLRCLSTLRNQGVFDTMRVVVVDDGSTDGTSAAISNEFPEVTLLTGDGQLYWTGAVVLGMTYAMAQGATSMVWLNDDALPHSDAIARLVNEAERIQGIASAQGYVQEGVGKRWYFPLFFRGPKGLIPRPLDVPVPISQVDACRGNLVAISRQVVNRIGCPDAKNIPHYNGDTDYSLCASRAGISCVVVGDALVEELDTIRANNVSWLLSDVPLATIWSKMFRKNSNFYPRMHWVYHARHWGWQVLLDFPKPYFRLVAVTVARLFIPRRALLKLYARRSHAWKTYAWTRSE